MQRKTVVTLILIMLAVVMFADFRINGVSVLESYWRQLETDSMNKLQPGGRLNEETDERAEKSSSFTVSAEKTEKIQLDNVMGSVNIKGEDRNDIVVDYQIYVYADTKQQAEEFIKQLEVNYNLKESSLQLFLKRVKIPVSIRGIRVMYDIKAPTRLALNISNRYGKLSAANFKGDVSLRNYYDKLLVRNIGEANISSRYGALEVDGINGDALIDAAYNKADIQNISGDLNLDSAYSVVNVNNVKGSLNVDARYGGLQFGDIGGWINLDSRYTRVLGANLQAGINGNLRYGELDLKQVKSDVDVSADYTDLSLQLIDDLTDLDVDCQVRYGDIKTNLPLMVEKENSEQKLTGTMGSGKIKLELKTDHADIYLTQ